MKTTVIARRQREKLLQREEILASALELFSERGYKNVSMKEIAERAEFAIGTLYKFFKNKEDLYKNLVIESAKKAFHALTSAIEEPKSELDKLRAYVKVKGEFFKAHDSLMRVYFAETQGMRFRILDTINLECKKQHAEFRDKITQIFQNGIKSKRFKKIANPFHLAVALENITNAFLFLWLEEPDRHSYPKNPDEILNIILKGLV